MQHPLRGTAIFNPGDTSIDTTYNKIQDEADLTEPREVKAIFGEIGRDNQGAVGVPVPDEPDKTEFMKFVDAVEDVQYRYSDEPDAPEDAIGPEPRLGHIGSFSLDELTKDKEAAVAATIAAQFHGCKSTEMFDALEKAEAAADLPISPGQGNPPRSPQESGSSLHVKDALRHNVVQKLSAALKANKSFLGDATAAAMDCERAVFDASKSLSVYQSIAANAVRVAHSGVEGPGVSLLPELLRAAKGEPKQMHVV